MDLENINIEKATERCNQLIKPEHANWIGISNQVAIIRVLNELEKKDKVINEMAKCIGQDMRCVRPEIECNKMTHDCRECVKEYYFNKVEREGK